MIDIRKLKELVRLMVNNDLTELDLRDSEEQVTLRRPGPATGPYAAPSTFAAPVSAIPAPAPAPVPDASAPAAAPASTEGQHKIESPMVGTFYTAPDPDSPAFVKVGDRVDPDKVVCLIEAMKIFNEIKAECSGTIEKILVNNAEAIEFGQALFVVNPD